MNKRIDTIKTLFVAQTPHPLSADNPPPSLPRISAGSVQSVKETFTEIERENDELRSQLASGSAVIEVDAVLIDPSPLSDRFRDDDDATFQLLKQSIAQRGQEVPVLLRPHPSISGRYQSAYGHRRVRATRELGIPVRAIVRDLPDEDLAIAQGLENAAREDLSFIERAIFAMRIEDAGHDRSVIQHALSIDRAEASKLLAVARAIPEDVLQAIGKSPKVGRPRWQSLAEALKDPRSLERARTAIAESRFAERQTNARFLAVLSAASRATRDQQVPSLKQGTQVLSTKGKRIGRAHHSERELKLMIDKTVSPWFASFLVEQLPALFDAFTRTNERSENTMA
jgi:ParB family transcriptional regulator, chromosome partitioning protein